MPSIDVQKSIAVSISFIIRIKSAQVYLLLLGLIPLLDITIIEVF